MNLGFDISGDELPIFLAEADDHLQTLDGILVQLERLKNDQEALQAAFRAAHTLKGMAGMIGHTRMVELTHALETVMDGFRKNELDVSSNLIDICLDAVDGLRLLRDEVVDGTESTFEFEDLLEQFKNIHPNSVRNEKQALKVTAEPVGEAIANLTAVAAGDVKINGRELTISAAIDSKSIASAARAFQLMLALQEMGTILEMEPSQIQIETTQPVAQFRARLATEFSLEEVGKELAIISEVSDIRVANVGEDAEPVKLVEESLLALPVANGKLAAAAQLAEQKPAAQGSRKNGKVISSDGAGNPARKNSTSKNDMMVRTSVERLDVLMGLVGELITDRNHLAQIRNRFNQNKASDGQIDQLAETVAHLSRITDQLQEEVMRIRMLPVGNVFHKFPRLVRDLAQKTGKKIDLVIHGEDTELDRSVIDEINDPLIHLLRNAVDHGIETPAERIAAGKSEVGKILLTARHEQGRIVLTVEDDGAGIDVERLRRSAVAKGLIADEEAHALPDDKALELIFLSGLSTSAKVTDISGRGVGMDIVRNNIQHINGNILVDTKLGQGTQFQIILPLTLAIIPTLLVRVDEITFCIPIVMVAETLKLTRTDIQTIRGKPVTILRNKVLPLVYVRDVFNLSAADRDKAFAYAVVVYHGKQQIGLVVDTLMGEEEVVVKSLGTLVGDIAGVSSATILGDGSVALIIDVTGMLKTVKVHV